MSNTVKILIAPPKKQAKMSEELFWLGACASSIQDNWYEDQDDWVDLFEKCREPGYLAWAIAQHYSIDVLLHVLVAAMGDSLKWLSVPVRNRDLAALKQYSTSCLTIPPNNVSQGFLANIFMLLLTSTDPFPRNLAWSIAAHLSLIVGKTYALEHMKLSIRIVRGELRVCSMCQKAKQCAPCIGCGALVCDTCQEDRHGTCVDDFFSHD